MLSAKDSRRRDDLANNPKVKQLVIQPTSEDERILGEEEDPT